MNRSLIHRQELPYRAAVAVSKSGVNRWIESSAYAKPVLAVKVAAQQEEKRVSKRLLRKKG